jgi:Ca-activated chloride channel family protein
MALHIQTDRRLIRAATSSTRYLLLRVTAPASPARGRRPVNVSLVLDRSGSMADGRKFALARDAVERSLMLLRPDDRFSLVVYDEMIDVLMPSALATSESRRFAMAVLRDIQPRGSTNLSGGWLRGCEQAAQFANEEQISRCLLLTDGLANKGLTDREELALHAGELRRRNVSTSTFGVGADFDERLLRDMAHEGGGNFYFIEDQSQITSMLTGELGEALEVTLKRASVNLALPSGAEAVCLNTFRQATLHDRNEVRVELGDLVSSQEVDVVVRLSFPPGALGADASVDVAVASASELVPDAERRMTWTYATHEDNELQPRNAEVERAVAQLFAARARSEATEANRVGRYRIATEVLEKADAMIKDFAGDDPEVIAMLAQLKAESVQYGAPMTAMAMKRSYQQADLEQKSRTVFGSARRKK